MKTGSREWHAEYRKKHRSLLAKKAKDYRARGGAAVERARKVAKGEITGRIFQVLFIAALKELTEETRRAKAEFQKLLDKAERKERKGIEKAKRAFSSKIFQPMSCLDCGAGFETRFPPKQIAFNIVNPLGVVRCKDCAYRRRLATHGGGPRRRCAQFNVPYETISPTVVFIRDDHTCQLCREPVDASLKAPHPKSPTLDHIWPLSKVVEGEKSPGHVLSNVQLAHLDCNVRKGAMSNLDNMTFGFITAISRPST